MIGANDPARMLVGIRSANQNEPMTRADKRRIKAAAREMAERAASRPPTFWQACTEGPLGVIAVHFVGVAALGGWIYAVHWWAGRL